jgi:soluble lytic murein transglycosylase-like protein
MALEGGIYTAVASEALRLRKALPSKHPNEITMEDLDGTGTYAALALLLSLRKQATMSARVDDGRDRLAIASSVGGVAGDWPFAMLLLFGLDRSVGTQAVIQHGPGYLATAYPPVYAGLIAEAAKTNGVPPELLYAVIRRESLFYPLALSNRGALGLFQFIPSTFETLDMRWNLLRKSSALSREGFLSDPNLAIDLGARWFGEELLDRSNGNILLAVMEHNAGYPAVKIWADAWEAMGRNGDIEYMVESAGFTETRIFARSVLADMAIAQAIGLFKTHQDTPSPE